MTQPYRIALYAAIAVIVTLSGALLGWYYAVQRKVTETKTVDTGRGLSTLPAFGAPTGSNFQNAAESILDVVRPAAQEEEKAAPRLWRIARSPISGFGFATSTPRLFFVEVSSGNILEADPLASTIVRRSNTLLPKSFDALFSSDGAVVMRFLENDSVRSYAGRLASTTAAQALQEDGGVASTTPVKLTGTYLLTNISQIRPTARGALVYLVDEANGATLMQSDWRGGAQKKIATLALKQWRLSLGQDDTIVVTQKAADSVSGSSYTVLSNGSLSPLIENRPGLVVNAKDATTALFSSDGALFVRTKSGTSALSISTSAEKCVWSRGSSLIAYCAVPRSGARGASINARYQGVAHSSDSWYRIDIEKGEAEEFFVPDGSAQVDVEKPQIDAGNRYIAFTNGADKSLWLFRIAP